MWAIPEPGVSDVKFHNAMITQQNLNKPVILTLLLSSFSGKMAYVWGLWNVFMNGCPPDKTIARYMNYRHKSPQRLCSYLSKTRPPCVFRLHRGKNEFNRRKCTYRHKQRGSGLFPTFPSTCQSHPLSVFLFSAN